jgi:CRISPR/Cas system-associated protein endoribonuclease Cas2
MITLQVLGTSYLFDLPDDTAGERDTFNKLRKFPPDTEVIIYDDGVEIERTTIDVIFN